MEVTNNLVGKEVELHDGTVTVVDRLFAQWSGYNVYLDIERKTVFQILDHEMFSQPFPTDVKRVINADS